MFPEQTSSPPKNWSIKIFNQHKTMKQNSLNIFRDNFNKTFKQSVDVVTNTALAKREAMEPGCEGTKDELRRFWKLGLRVDYTKISRN